MQKVCEHLRSYALVVEVENMADFDKKFFGIPVALRV